jgi:hypothetical protein
VEKQNFKDMNEANRFLEKQVRGRKLDDLLAEQDFDPVEEAQELAFKAMETDNPGEVFVLTLEALVLDPDCIDALILASKFTASSDLDLVEKLKLIISRAEKKMGRKFINLEEKKLAKVRKLLKEYDYEPSAAFLWGHVLERFLSGNLEDAE